MNPLLRVRTWLSALALLALAVPAGAAPVRPGTPGVLPTLEKYLPDDADGVLLVNVKQIVASPLFTKNFKKNFEELLAKDAVKPYLKDLGFDPLKDVEHAAFILGRSCHSETVGTPDGPIMMAFGKFDPAKLKKKMAALAKEHPKVVQVHDAAGSTLYEIRGMYGSGGYGAHGSGGTFAAQLDKETLIVGPRKEHVTDALAKAKGKKKTKLKYPALSKAVKKWKADTSVQGVALESMVINKSYHFEKGPGGKTIFHTMGERGFKQGVLNIQVKDEAKGSATLTVKDKGKLKALLKKWLDGKEEVVRDGRRAAEREEGGKAIRAMVNFIASVTIKGKDDAIVLEGKADAAVFQAFLDLTFPRRGGP
jgi:hypothetical protein